MKSADVRFGIRQNVDAAVNEILDIEEAPLKSFCPNDTILRFYHGSEKLVSDPIMRAMLKHYFEETSLVTTRDYKDIYGIDDDEPLNLWISELIVTMPDRKPPSPNQVDWLGGAVSKIALRYNVQVQFFDYFHGPTNRLLNTAGVDTILTAN